MPNAPERSSKQPLSVEGSRSDVSRPLPPLSAAMAGPTTGFRKPTAQGRMIERVMVYLFDAVLEDSSSHWLGPGRDKRRHFVRHLKTAAGDGSSAPSDVRRTARTASGTSLTKYRLECFLRSIPTYTVYLVTDRADVEVSSCLFLLRHVPLLRVLFRWTIRLLFSTPTSGKPNWPINMPAHEHLAERLRPLRRQSTGSLSERKRLATLALGRRPLHDHVKLLWRAQAPSPLPAAAGGPANTLWMSRAPSSATRSA